MDFNTLLRDALLRASGKDATVSELEVTAPRRPGMEATMPQKPQPVPYNYDNTESARAMTNSVRALDKIKGPGSANPGVWGLLPERLQQGALRNVIGALGDAFLVQGGADPTYGPRLERERVGKAMAGYDPEDQDSVMAAIQRVAGTGAPESLELADRMSKNYNDNQTRRQAAEQTAELRKMTMEQTQLYREGQAQDRDAQLIQRFGPQIGGMVSRARTPEEYAQGYARATAQAKLINPAFTAAHFGLPNPEDWTPELGRLLGLTTNQIVQSEDRAAGRSSSERNTDVRAGVSVGNSQRSAASSAASTAKPTNATILAGLIAKQNRGETLTPAEATTFKRLTNVSGGGRTTLPPGVLGSGRGGASQPAAPAGGRYPPPRAEDVAWLRGDPAGRKARFETQFGPGSYGKHVR